MKEWTLVSLSYARIAFSHFIVQTFNVWGCDEKVILRIQPTIIDPRGQDYRLLSGDIDPTKCGQFTVNPEMPFIDWENIPAKRIKILPLTRFIGKPLHEVASHVMNKYGKTHHIPGIEFWKWILEEYDTALPTVQEKYNVLKDGNSYFLFGSLVRGSGGRWSVPCAGRRGSEWGRNADWLVDVWDSGCRVVLLEI